MKSLQTWDRPKSACCVLVAATILQSSVNTHDTTLPWFISPFRTRLILGRPTEGILPLCFTFLHNKLAHHTVHPHPIPLPSCIALCSAGSLGFTLLALQHLQIVAQVTISLLTRLNLDSTYVLLIQSVRVKGFCGMHYWHTSAPCALLKVASDISISHPSPWHHSTQPAIILACYPHLLAPCNYCGGQNIGIHTNLAAINHLHISNQHVCTHLRVPICIS